MTARVSIDRIKQVVATDYDVSVAALVSHRRFKKLIEARHVAIYLAYSLTPHTTGLLGRLFGARDHTTILHAANKIAARRRTDIYLDGRLLRLERELAPPAAPAPEIQLALFIGPLFDCPFSPSTLPRATELLEAA